ncbi:MAG: ATP-binding protein [SAR324 cluster bacterium]|uniref:ATP-binding protein n=1 Tax=SAR324 cluster bacterium TaxID=2024889 RepID=A0A7X9IMJ2_9DELT|nr:ATP-binding protein [SAR324 cluster bacterium]
MVGPPGCGKSMLARRFPSILPPLVENEMLEVIKIHSIASQNVEPFLAGLRPFRSPHYNISMAGLVGGGVNLRPGEISLAHHGILFLDEFPEFQRGAIEALRVPLEYGFVDISRAKGSQRFPARFQLIAAMNPCPCGRLGIEGAHCTCSPAFLQTYMKKLSQPILDRIDMHIEVRRIPFDVIKQNSSTDCGTISLTLKSKVISTRKIQLARSKMLNAHISSRSALRLLNESPSKVQHLLESVQKKLGLSARGIIRSIKVARTIADLETSEHIQEHHLAEALGYRYLERMERFYSR